MMQSRLAQAAAQGGPQETQYGAPLFDSSWITPSCNFIAQDGGIETSAAVETEADPPTTSASITCRLCQGDINPSNHRCRKCKRKHFQSADKPFDAAHVESKPLRSSAVPNQPCATTSGTPKCPSKKGLASSPCFFDM